MKKFLSLILISIMAISLAACSPNKSEAPEEQTSPEAGEQEKDNEVGEDIKETEKEEVFDAEDKNTDENLEEDDKKEENQDETIKDDENETDKENLGEKDPIEKDEQSEAKKEKQVNIFFTSMEYVQTGNEDLEKLIPQKRLVVYDNDLILEEAVVKELLTDPKDEDLVNSIPDSVELIEVKVMDDIAYVDFSKDGMEGGSLEEILTIDQIVKSLLDLGTVKKVQFLLNGEVSDTLMGHITTTQPFEGVSQQ